MMTDATVIAAMLLSASARGLVRMPPPPCATTITARGAHLFLEPLVPPVRNSVVSVRLCLVPPKSGVGSYIATLTFDSATMRASRVDVSGGMQAANANVPGTVRLAGAAPEGFARGPLATITFRMLRRGALGKVRLTLVEVNARSGSTILADSRVEGYPASDKTLGVVQTKPSPTAPGGAQIPVVTGKAVPRIDSIVPSSGHIDPESVFDAIIYGKGFTPAGNSVLFGAASVDGLTSESGGTLIRFNAPTFIPQHGTVPQRRVQPGKYDVKVRTSVGTSNAVSFTALAVTR